MRRLLMLAMISTAFFLLFSKALACESCGYNSLHILVMFIIRAMIRVTDTVILVELHTS